MFYQPSYFLLSFPSETFSALRGFFRRRYYPALCFYGLSPSNNFLTSRFISSIVVRSIVNLIGWELRINMNSGRETGRI